MEKIKHITVILFFMCLLSTSAFAEKHLIFLDGYLGWTYSMPPYLVANYKKLEALPYSGFVVNGNVYTSYVMSSNVSNNDVTYERVWGEVKALKDVYQKKTDNFLRINVDFPGNFWDDAVWDRTTRNFAAVAKAAKNLGFKGILFDDEVYAVGRHQEANLMSNFKFPKREDVANNPEQYATWEREESKTNRGNWIDYTCRINSKHEKNSARCAYRNNNYTFKEHMDKVASRFKTIMEAMENEFPTITILVLHGPSTAHAKTNIRGHFIKPNSVFETNEYKGAMFLGFKQGLNGQASLHDMGEFYRYQTNQHFQAAYQWRKYDIVSHEYNKGLDETYRWVVPPYERTTWHNDVNVGFMVSDYGLADEAHPEYDTLNQCQPAHVESRLNKALANSDGYVIYYSDSRISECDNDIRWVDVAKPVASKWLNMVRRVYASIQPLTTTAIEAKRITQNNAMIFWDVSDYSTGQVEYGKTTAYGLFNKKETSFRYNHHEQLLRNLEPATTYHYRVISQDAQGNRSISEDYTFTTLPIPLTLSAIEAKSITQNNAMIFWDVSDYSTGQVEYGKTTAYGLFNKKETSFRYNHHEQLLRNLEPATTYHYRVISQDAQGNRSTSNDYSFTTRARP